MEQGGRVIILPTFPHTKMGKYSWTVLLTQLFELKLLIFLILLTHTRLSYYYSFYYVRSAETHFIDLDLD